jgi:hypothetical protein
MPKGRGKVSLHPSEVETYLIGLEYPATREDIILHAESRSAPEEIVDLMYRIPDRLYDNPEDITYEVCNLEE